MICGVPKVEGETELFNILAFNDLSDLKITFIISTN